MNVDLIQDTNVFKQSINERKCIFIIQAYDGWLKMAPSFEHIFHIKYTTMLSWNKTTIVDNFQEFKYIT